jgi:hypothetical protein
MKVQHTIPVLSRVAKAYNLITQTSLYMTFSLVMNPKDRLLKSQNQDLRKYGYPIKLYLFAI